MVCVTAVASHETFSGRNVHGDRQRAGLATISDFPYSFSLRTTRPHTCEEHQRGDALFVFRSRVFFMLELETHTQKRKGYIMSLPGAWLAATYLRVGYGECVGGRAPMYRTLERFSPFRVSSWGEQLNKLSTPFYGQEVLSSHWYFLQPKRAILEPQGLLESGLDLDL